MKIEPVQREDNIISGTFHMVHTIIANSGIISDSRVILFHVTLHLSADPSEICVPLVEERNISRKDFINKTSLV